MSKETIPVTNNPEVKKLPAVEVTNEVSWVNEKVDIPFDLKQGEASRLGLFLTKDQDKASYHLETSDNHFRSALLGKVLIKDREHNILYRDIDLKGMGPINYDLEVDDLTPGLGKNTHAIWGFYEKEIALNDATRADYFTEKGLRTYRTLAIIDLKEIVDSGGNKISVEEARNKKYIPENFKPVVEVRAFGTKARVKDAISESKEESDNLINDARIMVAKELGKKPEEFSVNEYMEWFADNLGKQIAIIHNDGYQHGGLHSHNITLDCRIVDLDAMKPLPEDIRHRIRIVRGDYDFALRSLKQFSKALKLQNFKELEETFKGSYKNILNKDIAEMIDMVSNDPNSEIVKALEKMAEVDQKMRKKAERNGDYWDESVDTENTGRLKEVITQIGWPSISKVGQEASYNAWLLAQHADKDIEFQKYCLELIQALPEGEVSKHDIAYLTDRIRRNQDLPQIYGTQFVKDQATGKYVPAPIEDPDQVEKRRKETGLDTLEENTKRINER